MNYSEITTALGKSMDTLSDSDLRSLNNMLVDEINSRIAKARQTIKRTLGKGAQVTVDDPRCAGKTYTIEKISAKMALLIENGSEYQHPVFGTSVSKKIRASLTMIKAAI
jgi:hypothetical protein